MTEILRQPGRVANGLSTITARLTKKNDEYIKSITKGQGVIDEQTGELRSTFDILQDLSKAWGDLTSVEKQELTETVAGKTQRSLFTAIMTNFETAVGATEAALNSEGSAMEENNKRMDSLEGKTKKLQSAWQQLARTTVNSDFIKGSLDFLTNLIKIGDALGGLVPIVTSLLGMVLMFKAQQIGEKVGEFSNAITSLINGFKILKQRIFGATNANVIYLGSAESAQVATTGLAASMSMLSLAVGAVTAAISLGVMAVNLWLQSEKEARQQAEKNASQYSSEANSIIELKEKYEKLTNNKGKDVSKSKELEDVIDTLVDKYGISKDKIDLEKTSREEAIKVIENEISKRQQLAALQSEKTVETGNFQFQIEEGRKMLETTDEWTSKNKKLKESYNLVGNTLVDLQSKYVDAITSLNKKNDRTKQEEKDLKNLQKEYSNLTNLLNSYKDGYKQTYENLKNGIQITNKQARVLENLGYINASQLATIESLNDYETREGKTIWDVAQMKEYMMSQTEKAQVEEEKYTKQIDSATDAMNAYKEALDGNIDAMINYGENLDLLKTAQSELNAQGSITAETFQSLTENNLLEYLDEVGGKLSVNITKFQNSTDKIKEQALANLQASTYEQIHALVLEDLKAKEEDVETTSGEAGTAIKKTGKDAVEAGANLLKAAGDAAQLNAQLAAIAGKEYVPSDKISQKINNILATATKTKAFIESWTPGSSKSITSRSGSKSKSSKEVYKPEIDALYKYENALDNAKDAVDRLNDALKNTDNFNEREKYLNQLIKATKDQIKATNNLKNAQVGQINNYIKQLKKQGFQISYNSKTNQLNINNMERLGKFTGNTAKNIEKMIKKIQDLNKDNRSLDGSIRDLNTDISDFNDQIKALPEEKLKKFNELMEEFQQSRLDQIQNEITDLQHEMENDPRLKMLEEQIAALEKQNDELDSQKELEEKLLAVEEAKIKLQNAQRQKTLQVYREGQGFVYEADPDTIKEAADELQQAQDDLNDKIKQDEIDRLNAEKEALENSYQSRIDALQNFLDEQNYLIDKANKEGIQTFEELQKKMAEFGLDNAENLKTATDWLNNYNKSLSDLNKTVGSILSSSTTATDGLIYSSQTQDKINSALSSIMPKIDSNTGLTLSNIRAETTDKNSNTGSIYINSIELPNVKDIDDFIAALKDLPRMASSQSTLRT